VLSVDGQGKVFYEKVVFSCAGRLINSFALLYSVADRDTFDPIVERIEETFRSGKTARVLDCPIWRVSGRDLSFDPLQLDGRSDRASPIGSHGRVVTMSLSSCGEPARPFDYRNGTRTRVATVRT
jgi:hypothetical protein